MVQVPLAIIRDRSAIVSHEYSPIWTSISANEDWVRRSVGAVPPAARLGARRLLNSKI
jgi:hypothetical protein